MAWYRAALDDDDQRQRKLLFTKKKKNYKSASKREQERVSQTEREREHYIVVYSIAYIYTCTPYYCASMSLSERAINTRTRQQQQQQRLLLVLRTTRTAMTGTSNSITMSKKTRETKETKKTTATAALLTAAKQRTRLRHISWAKFIFAYIWSTSLYIYTRLVHRALVQLRNKRPEETNKTLRKIERRTSGWLQRAISASPYARRPFFGPLMFGTWPSLVNSSSPFGSLRKAAANQRGPIFVASQKGTTTAKKQQKNKNKRGAQFRQCLMVVAVMAVKRATRRKWPR